MDRSQRRAVLKSKITDIRHGARNRNVCKVGASIERGITDGGYAGRNDDLFYGRSPAVPWSPPPGNLSIVVHSAVAVDRQKPIAV